MMRTSSVNGSEEMENETLAMVLELITPEELPDWEDIELTAQMRRDPDDDGSVQVRWVKLSITTNPDDGKLPRWKEIIKGVLKI